MVNYKYQDGAMVNPMQMNPEILSQMMSEQGAGQGVDFNGEPTPNISGEPSFADMYQEIKQRYDVLIEPLERKLRQLYAKLKENPTDSTIRNEIERIEAKIDKLEQQEDMELQQLEAEVQRTGEQIEAEKQMEGVPVEEGAEPEMAEEEMPMMQKGGVIGKHQSKPKVEESYPWYQQAYDKAKRYVQNHFLSDNWKSWTNDRSLKEVRDQTHDEINQLEETNPGIATAMNFVNPAYSFMSWEKDLAKDVAEKNKAGIGIGLGMGALGLLGLGGLGKAVRKGNNLTRKLGRKINYLENKPISKMTDSEISQVLDLKKNNFLSNAANNIVYGGGAVVDAAVRPIVAYGQKFLVNPIARIWKDTKRLPVWNPIEKYKGVGTFDYSKTSKVFEPAYTNWITKTSAAMPYIGLIGTGLYQGLNPNSTLREWLNNRKVIQDKEINKTKSTYTDAKRNIDSLYNEESDIIKDTINNQGQRQRIKINLEQTDDEIGKHQNGSTPQNKWLNEFIGDYKKKHPTGLAGYLNETPYTEYGVWANALGKFLDDSGRRNIEEQNRFRIGYNPYTYEYDRAQREYNDQMSMANKRYDIKENQLKRMMPFVEYGSLQQAQNARLAQQAVTNSQLAQNENDRYSAFASIGDTYGKKVSDAHKNMREQDFKNLVANEGQRKANLQALDTYHKEKQSQFDQLVNMSAITGNRRKQMDMFNSELFQNFITAAMNGVDLEHMLKMYQQFYPFYIPKQS